MPQFLLEIFSEEIPARMQAGAARDLERMAGERLKGAGLSWEALTTFSGPRRLTLVIEGLPAATPDREEELKGPKASAPEQALEGFLRKTGLTREQLVERDGVLFAVISSKGRATADLIPEMVDQIIRNFPWPKSMRWGSGTLRWVRPIKRIVALFDGTVVPFAVDGIQSGDVTEGHRFLGSGRPFAVKDFEDYRRQLEANFVLLDAADRRLRILEQAKAVCHAEGLELVDDDGLLDEVSGLAEWPTPILGYMDMAFLDLPPEVIRTSMRTHQKYFAVRDPKTGGLAARFVVVANVEATDGGQALAAGNSRVLSARLNDARFFWDEDQKVGFEPWLKKLEGVTFHAKLGTMAERVERVRRLSRLLAPILGADPDLAERAARLSKADLASGMVGEFPELQGVMGGYYARKAGMPDAIADAVRDHYRPQGPSDGVPLAPVTAAVALADKIEAICAFWVAGERPTGSKDPYAVRRAALGTIRLILATEARVPLSDFVSLAWLMASNSATSITESHLKQKMGENLGQLDYDDMVSEMRRISSSLPESSEMSQEGSDEALPDEAKALGEILPFFADRLKVLLRDQGQRHDLVDAVFALGDDDLVRIVRRVEALGAFLATDDGANLLAGYKRASNILRAEEKKGALPTGAVATGQPGQPSEETELAFATAAASTAVDTALDAEDFAAAMTALSRLRAPVDAFFDKVMVNSDVAAERDNRLKLLGQVREVMGRVADFGMIAG